MLLAAAAAASAAAAGRRILGADPVTAATITTLGSEPVKSRGAGILAPP